MKLDWLEFDSYILAKNTRMIMPLGKNNYLCTNLARSKWVEGGLFKKNEIIANN